MQGPNGWVVVVAGVAMAGCGLDDRGGADPEPPALASVTSAATNGACPPAGCSSNSPQIENLVGFHDLSLVGTTQTGAATQPNNVGLAIVASGEGHRAQIVQGARSYDLSVVGGRFVGTCAAPCTELKGTALTGATITLTLDGPSGPSRAT